MEMNWGLEKITLAYRPRINPISATTRTFYVTEDCNLRCRYCYEENKCKNSMNIETAKKAFDYFIPGAIKTNEEGKYNIWEFIGGEPFMEIDLIEEMTDYMLLKYKEHNMDPHKNILSFTTNGTLFTPRIKEYLMNTKALTGVSVGLSIDGVKEIHDYNRSDSFDEVMKNYWWWRRTFPWNTIKSTLNHDSLPYIADSVKFFVEELKLQDIWMNIVFENVWEDGDADLYKEQLYKVADYLLEDNRYTNVFLSLFDPVLLMDSKNLSKSWCGCGNSMMAVDPEGKLYPCLRFRTLNKQQYWDCGNIENGVNWNKLLPFKFYHNLNQESKCNTCDIRSGCAWCPGQCYDELGTIFERTLHCCDLHRARVDVNKYFFNEIAKKEQKTLEEVIAIS